VTTPAPVPDGRSARSQRTREAVVDALLALIQEGNPRPTAREIAQRANISLRSVYVHFDDLEDLFFAAAQRQTSQVAQMLEPIPPDAPLARRVELACEMRARVFEHVGPVRRAAALQAPCSRTLSDLLERVRKASRDGLAELFADELAVFDESQRRSRLAAVDAVLGIESWELMRTTHGLSVDEARDVMIDSAMVLLVGKVS
jgi:AcrR family transcriptional regulator